MTTKLTIKDHGPLLVEGEFELLDGKGAAFDLQGKSVIAICRCGHTKNPPFCDGEHKKCGFQSAVSAAPGA